MSEMVKMRDVLLDMAKAAGHSSLSQMDQKIFESVIQDSEVPKEFADIWAANLISRQNAIHDKEIRNAIRSNTFDQLEAKTRDALSKLGIDDTKWDELRGDKQASTFPEAWQSIVEGIHTELQAKTPKPEPKTPPKDGHPQIAELQKQLLDIRQQYEQREQEWHQQFERQEVDFHLKNVFAQFPLTQEAQKLSKHVFAEVRDSILKEAVVRKADDGNYYPYLASDPDARLIVGNVQPGIDDLVKQRLEEGGFLRKAEEKKPTTATPSSISTPVNNRYQGRA